MIGVLLITHSNLGEVLLQNAQYIIGSLPQIGAVSQKPGTSYQALHKQVQAVLEELDDGDGVLILVDVFGGTPSNVAMSFCDDTRYAVVTGLNTAMLLKVLNEKRNRPLVQLAQIAADAGKKAIAVHRADEEKELGKPFCSNTPGRKHLPNECRDASINVIVKNKLGLHASNSAKLVKSASRFTSDITLTKDDVTVNVKSIMGVLMLAAAEGTILTVRAVGDDARSALEAIAKLFEDKFDEE